MNIATNSPWLNFVNIIGQLIVMVETGGYIRFHAGEKILNEKQLPKPSQNNPDNKPPADGVNMGERLAYMQFDEKVLSAIRSLKYLVERELPIGLDRFYDQVKKQPQLAHFFSGEQHMRMAKGAQMGHWANIADANFNEEYQRNVEKIGSVHARIGLTPQWYIGGYALVLEHLVEQAVLDNQAQNSGFMKRKTSGADFASAVAGLVKAVMLDLELAVSVYARQAEEAKQQAEKETLKKERALVSEVFGKALSAMNNKDIGYRIEEDLPKEYHALRDDFNSSLRGLAQAVENISDATSEIANDSRSLHSASQDLAQRSEQQAASVEESVNALEEITRKVKGTSSKAIEAGKLVGITVTGAERSGAVVNEATTAMDAINKSSSEISNIIGVIDEIAFQTNLLALNAGVEAARAGDAGKGFAVVAQEVRELAQRSANAAKEIKDLIVNSGEQVSKGVSLVGQTGEALSGMVQEVKDVDLLLAAIVDATKEQSVALDEVHGALNVLDQGTQQDASMVEQTTAACNSVADRIEMISGMLSQFRTGKLGRAAASGQPPKPAAQPIAKTPVHKAFQKVTHAFVGNAAIVTNDDWEEF